MSDTMESTGKTVDEAIREALLRMGLRREEVNVTVVQEARGGFLGVGRREAVVKVEKKQSRRRGGRGGSDDEGRRSSRSRRGGSRREGERLDDGQERRSSRRRSSGRRDSERPDEGDGRGRRSGRPAAEKTEKTEKTDDRQPRQEQSRRGDRDGERREGGSEGSGRSRRRRPRRRRKPAAAAAEVAETKTTTTDGQLFNEDAQQPAAAPEPQKKPVVVEEPTVTAAPPAPEVTPEAAPEPVVETAKVEAPTPAAGMLAEDVVAINRVKPFAAADAEDMNAFLEKVATSLMVKGGFPCRVQVREDEYKQVKVVVDDRSAGVLIGRHGATVESVELLVEKMASQAVGERVRMNLDINNYRNRREGQLVERARNAAAEVRNIGEPVALEPAHARERRLVHLYIEDQDDLVTYTEDDGMGKHVVICRPDQVPEQYRPRDEEAPVETEAAPVVETEPETVEPTESAAEVGEPDDDPDIEVEIVTMDDPADGADEETRRDDA